MNAIAFSPTMRVMRVPEVPETLRLAAEGLRHQSGGEALGNLRAAAWEAFESLGIPETKHEDFSFVSSADLKNALTRVPEAGREGSGGSSLPSVLPSGLQAFTLGKAPESLASAWTKAAAAESDAPAALAAALAPEPVVVRIGSPLASPLTLKFSGATGRSDYAIFLRVEAGVEASLSLETEAAPDAYVNATVFVSLGENARLDVFQSDSPAGFQTLKVRFAVERDARLNLLAVSTGSRLARLAIEADLLAPGAEIDLRSATAVAGSNRAHKHLKIRHAAPDCVSKQLFKAVVPGAGRSSVDGTVIVERGAQRTDARQLLQHLLQSSEGRADAKPRLLIHADDVKCSHGATVGKTDPAQLFYLLSRGLDRPTAQNLLTQAFLGEALAIAPEEQRAAARQTLMSALSKETHP